MADFNGANIFYEESTSEEYNDEIPPTLEETQHIPKIRQNCIELRTFVQVDRYDLSDRFAAAVIKDIGIITEENKVDV